MTSPLFVDGRLDQERFPVSVRAVFRDLLGIRILTRCDRFGAGHVFLAVVRPRMAEADEWLRPALKSGQTVEQLVDSLMEFYTEPGSAAPSPVMDERSFAPEALALLEDLAEQAATARAEDLLPFVCRRLSRQDRDLFQYFLDLDRIESGDLQVARDATTAPRLFSDSGEPTDAWTEDGRDCLRRALGQAGRTGYHECQLSHFVLALLDSPQSRIQEMLRVFGQGARLGQSRDHLAAQIGQSPRVAAPPLLLGSFSRSCRLVFDRLASAAAPCGPLQIAIHVLENLDLDAVARDALSGVGLRLDAPAAAAWLKKSLAAQDERLASGASGQVPPGLAHCVNLSSRLGAESAAAVLRRKECEELERALFARGVRCVTMYGESGSGRTKVLEAVVQRAARGETPFLRNVTFLRFDAGSVEPSACGPTLSGLLRAAADRRDLVLVIENFAPLAAHAAPQLRQLAGNSDGVRIIGIMLESEYAVFNAAEAALGSARWNVHVPPPGFEDTADVLRANVAALEDEFHVRVQPESLVPIVQAADKYLRSLQRPGRAVQLLRWACDEAAFRAASGGSEEITFAVAARALSRRMNVNEEQILGDRGTDYYRDELEKQVIGQPEAASALAENILLTRRGARGGDRPAGVFLFVGETGTGKTLMAEAVARLFSPRGTLHHFRMGDYKVEHSTTRLIGADPSFVGYEQGGALVNALLKDPAGVLLFDEAEKAHPAVWDTCLDLFSNGVVQDARGRTSSATQSLIILTANIASEVIGEGLRNRYPFAVIAEQMRGAIRDARHPATGRPYFRPEFLGRIDQIIVFRPLSRDELTQIARLEIEKKVREHREQSSIELKPLGGDWTPVAEFVSGLCGDDPAHGRAVERVLKNMVSVPLAGLPASGGQVRTAQVGVARGRLALFDSHGSPLA